MWWWDGGWGWGPAVVMGLLMIVFWGLVAWAAVALLRRPDGVSTREESRSPAELLAERFARGEIDEEEFRRRRDVLAERSARRDAGR